MTWSWLTFIGVKIRRFKLEVTGYFLSWSKNLLDSGEWTSNLAMSSRICLSHFSACTVFMAKLLASRSWRRVSACIFTMHEKSFSPRHYWGQFFYLNYGQLLEKAVSLQIAIVTRGWPHFWTWRLNGGLRWATQRDNHVAFFARNVAFNKDPGGINGFRYVFFGLFVTGWILTLPITGGLIQTSGQRVIGGYFWFGNFCLFGFLF